MMMEVDYQILPGATRTLLYLSELRRFAKNLNIQLTTPGPIKHLWSTTKPNQEGGEQFFAKHLKTKQ